MKTNRSAIRAFVFLWFNRVRSLFRRGQLDREMAEEIRLHVEEQTERYIEAGMEPRDAQAAARRQFGGVAQIQERSRDVHSWIWLEQTLQDICYALRQLGKSPGFTVVVIATLALGTGATTAIYSIVNTAVINPVPGPQSDRIVQIGEHVYSGIRLERASAGASAFLLSTLYANAGIFSDLAWADRVGFEHEVDGFIAGVSAFAVSPNMFSVLGATPILGRTFATDEAVPRDVNTRLPDGDAVIVLSYSGWQSLFHGRSDVLGQTIDLSGRRLTVVGVMPAWFQYPSAQTQFWVPTEPLRLPDGWGTAPNTFVIARLKPGVTLSETQAMLDTLAQRLSDDPALARRWTRNGAPSGLSVWVAPLQELLRHGMYGQGAEQVRHMLLGLFAAIAFVLLIVCANVANLMLARTERRQHELALRAAIGAGWARLTRQLLTESVLLSVLGGLGGLLVMAAGMKLLLALNTMPRLRPAGIDGSAFGLTVLVALLSGLFFGLVPAWRGARPRLSETLAQSGATSTSGVGGRRYRNVLVVVQVALAMTLLTGAGLVTQSVLRLLRVNPGYDPHNLVTTIVPEPRSILRSNGSTEPRNQFFERVRERFAALPGTSGVGIWKQGAWEENVFLEGQTEPVEVYRGGTGIDESDFFRVARAPLIEGRYLERRDIGENVASVVVNETMARMCWPGGSALGQSFRASTLSRTGAETTLYEVVGVVSDIRAYSYSEELRPTFFRPFYESSLVGAPIWVVVRTALDPTLVIPSLRQELIGLDPDLHTPSIWVTRQRLYDATLPQRTYRNYLLAFGAVGLALAALGIYGVLAYSVVRRTKEIGIRMAVGAERRHVLGMVIRDGTRLIFAGLAIGLLASFWLTRYLQNQLFEVSPTDPGVLASVIVVLSTVALLACYLPARRASRVDPVIALRAE